MCDPIIGAVVSAAASVAGSAMQASAQQDAINRQNELQRQAMERSRKLRMEELTRQGQMRKENQGTLDETVERYQGENQTEELLRLQEERANAAQGAVDKSGALTLDVAALPPTGAGATIVTDDLSKRLALASQKSRERLTALSALGGYDENFLNQAMQDQAGNRQMNLVNNMRQGSLATTQAGVDLINQNVGKASPADTSGGQIVAGVGNLFGQAVKGGVFG